MGPKYEQHYRKVWENYPEFKTWLRPVEGDLTRAYCAYCKCEIYAKLTDLKKHVKTQKHGKRSNPFTDSLQSKLTFKTETQISAGKLAEAAISMFVAEHCSFLTCDHLSELCKKQFSDSKAGSEIQLHRTKCREIVTNVLAPHFSDALREDIGENVYSLIIDESTDISVTKLLGVCIRYFSVSMTKFVCTFLGLVKIESGTAEAIVSSLKYLLAFHKLKPENMIGLGVDNASVNTGVNNGVYERLKRELHIEHLLMIRCVCHSLQLAISHATEETLPRNIDFLVRETYNWFSHSAKRQALYRDLYRTLNGGEEPLKILSVCDTRWLSMEPAVTRILSQWDELKLHFKIVRTKENCFTAEMLYNMLCDPVNKLYLQYLKPILQEVQKTNKSFESESTDPTKLLLDLTNLIQSVSRRVLNPTARIDTLSTDISSYLDPKPYMGYEFERLLTETKLNPETEDLLRKRCIDFTVKLAKELRNRLPSNFHILKKMNVFSVNETLKTVKGPIVELAELFGCKPEVVDSIVNQWRNISFIKWFSTENTVEFWAEVGSYKDSAGMNPFQELWSLAVKVLSLPHSNAEVERVFSQIGIVKTKLRNRMNNCTLNAILTVKSGLQRVGKCCHSYEVPQSVLRAIGTMATYTTDTQASDAAAGPSHSTSMEEYGSEDEDM